MTKTNAFIKKIKNEKEIILKQIDDDESNHTKEDNLLYEFVDLVEELGDKDLRGVCKKIERNS